jgi:hypothetical protein
VNLAPLIRRGAAWQYARVERFHEKLDDACLCESVRIDPEAKVSAETIAINVLWQAKKKH